MIKTRIGAALLIGLVLLATFENLGAAPPHDLLPLSKSSPNYVNVFRTVATADVQPDEDTSRAGREMLAAVYAYLAPDSPVTGDTAYRDRLLVLLDYHLGRWADGEGLRDIALCWEASYAWFLLKHHRPGEVSAERTALYDEGIRRNNEAVLAENPLLYDRHLLANLWLNGDIRLAMGVYFGALALGETDAAEKARAAIDEVMTKTVLADGGTHYVGFWTESPTYHDETIRCLIYWWKLTGSTAAKQALDGTLRYAPAAVEPCGFAEQSSSIPYKHMYNGLHAAGSSLWKAYLYNDGYNYHFGRARETADSTELLNCILYQPDRRLLVPPADAGVFFDGNIQGPRGRFGGNWGWIANGRNVQTGGPERVALIEEQGYEGRQGGKNTFVGAYALGPKANKTSLQGALDSVLLEFKESPGEETDFVRGKKYRFLSQDERTSTITRKNFGTLATTYRISRRTSSLATKDWEKGATDWIGHQLWVMTGERIIGLVQIEAAEATTIYGLDARLVFSGGRRGIIGEYLELRHPEANIYAFGQLKAKVHAGTFTGPVSTQRIAISEPGSNDDYSALLRLHALEVPVDKATKVPAGTRHWLVLDVTREGRSFASAVMNVLPGDADFAVLQFKEGRCEIRIVQNLRDKTAKYSGKFTVDPAFPQTSMHRSWSETVSLLEAPSGIAEVATQIPHHAHLIAVSSAESDDHGYSFRSASEVFPDLAENANGHSAQPSPMP